MRIVLLMAVTSAISATKGYAEDLKRPNVLLILADDLGYGDVGFHGCRDIPTPNLDRLANEGVRFTSGYVSGPYCSPTRAGLLTGRYQQRFGHEFNSGRPPNVPEDFGLPVEEKTIADRLRQIGYATSLVGKWHLGAASRFQPQQRGFDEFFGFLDGQHPYFPGSNHEAPILRGIDVVKEDEYLTDAFTREALSFLDRQQNKPFFLYLAYNAVHSPHDAKPEHLKRFASIEDERRRNYAARLVAMDEGVGHVLMKLKEKKLDDNTIVVFLSDNGGPPANGSTNTPLKGRKSTTWEGGIRVPFVIRWPGHISPGSVYNHPVIQLDLLPTILVAAGQTISPEEQLDGVDLLPFLNGKKSGAPHQYLYWRFGKQLALRNEDWKLVRGRDETVLRLYNLKDDIAEEHDLFSARPEKARELLAVYESWNKTLQPPRWIPPNQRDNAE